MKSVILLLTVCFSFLSYGQLPFYYEKNLPLLAQPKRVAEYYSEYHTQATAHYYNHILDYDSLGRIKKHVKSNVGLLNRDSLPEVFHDIISQDPITITYFFNYDEKNRYDYFRRIEHQEGSNIPQQDEDWNYDIHDMLTEHYFFQINNGDTVLRSPSAKRIINRNETGEVLKIENFTYSFSDKGLVLSEITDFSYSSELIDSIIIYKVSQGIKSLFEKKYNITFLKYTPLNTDSLLFSSYTSEKLGEITEHTFTYDELNRKNSHLIVTPSNDTIEINQWLYESNKTIEATNNISIETVYDETGYPRYVEEFFEGNPRAVPSERNTRHIQEGKITNAIMEVWDPVTLFYRKDTEYRYFYEDITGVSNHQLVSKNSIYPNPTTGIISLEETDGIRQLELISMDGRSILQPIHKTIILDVPKGLYILRAHYKNDSVFQTKLVIQ